MPQTVAPDLSCLPFFASLPPEALERLQARLTPREVPADEELLQRGVRNDLFAIVEQGLVCLEGADGILHTAGPGDSFGEAMLRFGVPSVFSARTISPTTLWTLSHADWLALRQPAVQKTQETVSLQASEAPVASPPPAAPPARTARRRHFMKGWPVFLAGLALALLVVGPRLATAGGGWLALQILEAQRPDEAASVLRLALAVQPDSASLHDAYGYLLFRQGDLEAAQAEFEQALQLEPELASALNNLGVTVLAAGQPEQAQIHLVAASTLNPGEAGILVNLGDAYFANGDLQAAMNAYQGAINLDPSLQQARSRWATLALWQGQLEAARQAWLEVIEADPQDALAQLGLGAIAWQEGRPAAAAQYLQSARQADPGDALARLYLGLALQAIDRPEKAAVEFEQSLALSQDLAVQKLAREHLMELYPMLYAPDWQQSAGVEGGEQPPAP
jgi:tetratricopeptide (TPR) repeat protein